MFFRNWFVWDFNLVINVFDCIVLFGILIIMLIIIFFVGIFNVNFEILFYVIINFGYLFWVNFIERVYFN